jgi:heavy metal efflux system protein
MKIIDVMIKIFFSAIIVAVASEASSQVLPADSIKRNAARKHPAVVAASYSLAEKKAVRATTGSLPKTELSMLQGQYNSHYSADRNFTITQTIPFPTVFARQRKLNESMRSHAAVNETIVKNEIAFAVANAINDMLYLKQRRRLLLQHDTLVQRMLQVASLQYRVGETALMTKTAIETQSMQIRNEISRNESDLKTSREALSMLCSCSFEDIEGELEQLPEPSTVELSSDNPRSQLRSLETTIASKEKEIESSRVLPDITIGYFNQTLVGYQNVNGSEVFFGRDKRFDGFQLGLAIPLFYGAYSSAVRAATYKAKVSTEKEKALDIELRQEYKRQYSMLQKNINSLAYYRTSALANAELLRQHSAIAFEKGETDYRSFLLNLQMALEIEEEYVRTIYEYNQNVISIRHLNGDDQ